MTKRRIIIGGALVLALAAGLGVGGWPAVAQHQWGPGTGGAPRWYQHNQFQWIVPFEEPGPIVSFAIDAPGYVTGVYAAPHEAGGYDAESYAVGGLLVNGRPAASGLWVTAGPLAPLVLTRLAAIPRGPIRVVRGDVVTVTLSDGGSGAPTWPETTWVLEVTP